LRRGRWCITIAAVDPDAKTQPPGIIDSIIGLVHGSKNELQAVFAFVAHVYLKLTWHDSASSYCGAAADRGQDELDPTEFLLDVVNDAKMLRNKVEDFLSVPRNTFENEWPTERRLGNVTENARRDFEALVTAPLT
jgi:hypothetical protein